MIISQVIVYHKSQRHCFGSFMYVYGTTETKLKHRHHPSVHHTPYVDSLVKISLSYPRNTTPNMHETIACCSLYLHGAFCGARSNVLLPVEHLWLAQIVQTQTFFEVSFFRGAWYSCPTVRFGHARQSQKVEILSAVPGFPWNQVSFLHVDNAPHCVFQS